MRVVVTGGAGFIGVVQRTDRVLNVDKLTYAANLSSRAKMACKASYQFAQADIADEARIADLLKDARSHHPSCRRNACGPIDRERAGIHPNYVVGTSVLLDSARKYWSDLPSGRQTRFVS